MKWKLYSFGVVVTLMVFFSGCLEPGGDSCLRIVDRSDDPLNPPQLVTNVIDFKNDYLLEQPIMEDIYNLKYENYNVIPPALDISSVDVALKNDNYQLDIQTRDDLSQLFIEGQHSVQFVICTSKKRIIGLKSRLFFTRFPQIL